MMTARRLACENISTPFSGEKTFVNCGFDSSGTLVGSNPVSGRADFLDPAIGDLRYGSLTGYLGADIGPNRTYGN